MSPYQVRLALKAAGFSPIPCKGKRPLLEGWQHKLDASDEEMRRWQGRNTGMLCNYNPAGDADITDPEAGDAVEEATKDWFSDRGEIPVRVGNAPKRAFVFRTSHPFPKFAAHFVDKQGRPQKIEILCEGQQLIVDGIHPDTKQPYSWFGGSPVDVGHDRLVEVTEAEMHEYVEYVAAMLGERFGFTRVQDHGGNGQTHEGGAQGPVDLDAELQAMTDGKLVNDVQIRIIPSLLRNGEHPDDVLKLVVDETIARVGAHLGWTPEREARYVIPRILSAYRLFLKDYDQAMGVPSWLPGEFHEAWLDRLTSGHRPDIGYNRGGFYVRKQQEPNSGSKAHAEAAPKHKVPLIEAKPFVRFDPAMLPPREWLYGGHYQRGIITATVGPGGGGKSSLNLVELIAMCTALPLLDEQPLLRCRAWYHNAEDSRDEIYRRIAAVCQHYAIDQSELEGWLFVTSGLEMPIKIAALRNGTVTIDGPTAEAIIRTISDNEIGIASFDPLVAHHRTTENVTGDMDQVVREFARIASATDCSIEIVHHTRKPAPGQEELSVIDSRGAGAIIDAVRSARVLNTMSKTEADNAGIDDVDRRLHFRIDKGKANMAPPTAAKWHKFVGVELPNSDNVGVATPWDFPGQGASSPQMAEAERAAEHVFLSLLVRLTLEGRNVSHSAGTNYAPPLFVKEPEAKVAKLSKRALEDAMRRLFVAKRIKVEHRETRGGRKANALVMV